MAGRKIDELVAPSKLKEKFDFYGNFYLIEDEPYRNVLVILKKEKGIINRGANLWNLSFDALFIMMNPGGSTPIDGVFRNSNSKKGLDNLVEANPDRTQDQICRLAQIEGWKRILILNTSDFAHPTSGEYHNRLIGKVARKLPNRHSLFNNCRRIEANNILGLVEDNAPICIA